MAVEINRSPLKDRPLNVAGQSGDSALRDFVDDHFIFPMFLLLTLFLISIWEWFASVRHLPRQPAVIGAVAFCALAVAGVYWRYTWKKVLRLKLGRDGERAVGQFLDSYSEPDASVFHDVPSPKGNIDHVVICSRGIFAIETKTRTNPSRGDAVVLVKDDGLFVNGNAPDRDPVAQACACGNEVKRILKSSTGKTFDVRPVVVFPGWFIQDRRQSRSTWVLEPKALPAWIKKEQATIAPADVQLATYHLSRYIRTYPQPSRSN